MNKIVKRNGSIVNFNRNKITNAIINAMKETKKGVDKGLALDISETIEISNMNLLSPKTVEIIQNEVENELMKSERKDVAKKYILYRYERDKTRDARKRKDNKLLTDDFISKYKHMESPMGNLGNFVYYRTYSRWLPEENRREYWWETVRRAVEYNCSLAPTSREEAEKLYDNIFNMRQFLSGRTFWVGGTEVAKKYPMANFNCSFEVIDSFKSFRDLFYLLMIGSGVGVRILKDDIKRLPKIRSDYKLIHEGYNPVNKGDREDNTSVTFFKNNSATITVGDSKEGWVQALDHYLELLYNSEYQNISTIIINYNNVRPSGEILKTFGGTASGHQSIKNMFIKIDKILRKRAIEENKTKFNIKPIDCLDIANIIGENVVVGGVRRTAEIMLIDYDDKECVEAKNNLYKKIDNQWVVDKDIIHRQMSNNSIYYKKRPSRKQLHWQIEQMRYSGEPGWINEVAGAKRRENMNGCNPSMPKDVLVQTTEGVYHINELEGKKFFVKSLNGDIAKAECWLSSKNAKVYDIDFRGQRHTYATAKHKFPVINKDNTITRKLVSELSRGDRIPLNRNELQGFSKNLTYEDGLMAGMFIGDGSIIKRKDSGRYVASYTVSDEDKEVKDFIDTFYTKKTGAILKWNRRHEDSKSQETNFGKQEFVKEYLMDKLGLSLSKEGKQIPNCIWTNGDNYATGLINGLFSTDGSVYVGEDNKKGARVQLITSQIELARDVQKLLSFYGVSSTVDSQKTHPTFPNGKTYNREYISCHVNLNGNSILRFNNIFKLINKRKQDKIDLIVPNLINIGYVTVDSVNYRSSEPVWDISVEHDQHVFPSQHCYTGNCGEILLDSKGLCNLTTINVMAFVEDGVLDKNALIEAQKLSARSAYRMTCVELELPEWNEVQQRDRLTGCSLTGWQDMVNATNFTKEDESNILKKLKKTATDAIAKYSKILGTEPSLLVTTTKPEGTLSQLPTVSSGIHYSHSPYYIRRVRINSRDPLVKVCEELGYPVYAEVGQEWETCTTKVVEFPCKSPDGKTKFDVSAIEQLENYQMFMKNYVQHNCSITVHVRDNEWDEVEQWVWDNWDDVVALSFLSLSDNFYELMPYEAITEQEYNKRNNEMRPFVPSLLKKYEAHEVELDIGNEGCESGICPIR